MATFHEQAPDAAHGAIGPERIVITRNARLVIVEHVMGAAIEQLQFSEDRYWKELRVPCPRAAGLPVIDQRADVLQVGMVALALILCRSLTDEDSPTRIGEALASAWAMSAGGDLEPLPAGLRSWFTSTLQLDPRAAFVSAIEARHELEKVFERNDDIGAPSALEAFLARYYEATDSAVEPAVSHGTTTGSVAFESVTSDPPHYQTAPQLVAKEPLSLRPIAAELTTPQPVEPDPIDLFTPEPVSSRPLPRESTAIPAKQHRSAEPVLASRFESASTRSVLAEEAPKLTATPSTPRGAGRSRAAVAAIALVAVVVGGTVVTRRYLAAPAAATVTTGTVAVTTNPPGAEIVLDGQTQGLTPMKLTVPAGSHVLELRGAGDPRTIALDVTAGSELSQYIELAKGPLAAGSLQIRTEPAGAIVVVDGVPRGTSPVTVADLTPGEHSVVLEKEGASTRQSVTVEAGATASLVAQMPAAQGGPVSGWITVSTPKSVQLFEEGRLLGSSDSERLMVPAGTHQLDIVNDAIGYRGTKTVQVAAGKVTSIKVEFPKGTIALNAVPWADVWIDGEKVGETPIGNLPMTIGPHEIIFRHPDLGEQRYVTNVTLTAPARVSVDMRKKP
jgi:hypothetical protein